MQVGFIGIGVMGRPMTLNLLKAKHHVTIYARHPEKPEVQEVLNSGAKLAPSASCCRYGFGYSNNHAYPTLHRWKKLWSGRTVYSRGS